MDRNVLIGPKDSVALSKLFEKGDVQQEPFIFNSYRNVSVSSTEGHRVDFKR